MAAFRRSAPSRDRLVTDTELARFREGDPSLFRRLVEAESPRLLRYAESLCDDGDDAEDLVHAQVMVTTRGCARDG
jgi:hypothetical protein